jgi:N-dimethylarginine dimethylaminohydrolase
MASSRDIAHPQVYSKLGELPPRFWEQLAPQPIVSRVLMCEPSEFKVVDVKNPFMSQNVGGVDSEKAYQQWVRLLEAIEKQGTPVEVISPVPGCEDMVFTANPTLIGRTSKGLSTVVLSKMRFPSRQREVVAYRELFEANGYRIVELGEIPGPFEGGGDAIWHPGRRLIWGGHGYRSVAEAYRQISQIFEAPVVTLKLINERFYHLDTCFSALDESTALIYPEAFDADSLAMIQSGFLRVLECDPEEAARGLACNCIGLPGKKVILPAGNPKTEVQLKSLGYDVTTVELSEFHKSGGSAYCLKQWILE